MTKEEFKARARRFRARAIVLGVLLALLCRTLPTDYQVACEAVVEVAALACGA